VCPGKLYGLQLGAPGMTLVNVMFSHPYYNTGNVKLVYVAFFFFFFCCGAAAQCWSWPPHSRGF